MIALSVNLQDGGRTELLLTTRGFDIGSNTLHLDRCTCQISLGRVDPRKPQVPMQSFTTQVSLKSGEYTVLGALGSQPIFIVLKVERTGRMN